MIKPIKDVLSTVNINMKIKQIEEMSIEGIVNELEMFGISLWKLNEFIYVAHDYETNYFNIKYRYVKASMLGLTKLTSKLVLEYLGGIKLYNIASLRRILRGLEIHSMYEYLLSMSLPDVKVEVPFRDDTHKVVGRADVVTPYFVAEIKSRNKEKERDYLQLLAYLVGLKQPHGYLVYMNHVKLVGLDSQSYNKYLKEVSNAHNLLNSLASLNSLDEIPRMFDTSDILNFTGGRFTFEELVHLLRKEGFIQF